MMSSAATESRQGHETQIKVCVLSCSHGRDRIKIICRFHLFKAGEEKAKKKSPQIREMSEHKSG